MPKPRRQNRAFTTSGTKRFLRIRTGSSWLHCAIAVISALTWIFQAAQAQTASAAPLSDCHVGTYRLADGRDVDIAPSDGGTLRLLMLTGERGGLHLQKDGTWASTYGWTDHPDGNTVSFSDCGKGEIILRGSRAGASTSM